MALVMTVAVTSPAGAATWSTGTSPSGFTNLSCVSPTFCMSLTGFLSALTYDGTSWTEAGINEFGQIPVALSCVASTSEWCIAAQDYSRTYLFDGTSWSDGPDLVGPTNGGVAISCTSSTFCVAEVTNDVAQGDFETYTGSTWTVDGHTTSALTYTGAVDCVTSTFCAAVDAHDVFTFNGASWRGTAIRAGGVDGLATLSSVTCRTVHFCLALDTSGDTYRFNGSSWLDVGQTPAAVAAHADYYPDQVSCASTQLCVAVGEGFAWEFNGFEWSAALNIDHGASGHLQNVDCTSTTFCMITDGNQNYFVYKGGQISRFPASETVVVSPHSLTTTSVVKVTVRLSGHPVPTGTVTMTAPDHWHCTVHLSAGTSTCSIPRGRLPTGSNAIHVSYGGDSTYLGSQRTVTVIVH